MHYVFKKLNFGIANHILPLSHNVKPFLLPFGTKRFYRTFKQTNWPKIEMNSKFRNENYLHLLKFQLKLKVFHYVLTSFLNEFFHYTTFFVLWCKEWIDIKKSITLTTNTKWDSTNYLFFNYLFQWECFQT